MPEPLALELLGAMVPDHDVRILDLRVDPDLNAMLTSFKPDMVAVTALTSEVYAAREILQKVKDYSSTVFSVVGGHHATLLPEDFQLPYVDAICLGEGEFVFPQLVDALEKEKTLHCVHNLVWRHSDGRFVRNGYDVPYIGTEFIPHPRRELVADYRHAYSWLYDKPDTSIATGRGCPYRCNFCSVWEFYNGVTRQMSASRVMEEIRSVKTKHVTILDDNFLFNAGRVNEIADMVKAEGLHMRFGMECRTDSIARYPQIIEKWAGIGLENVLLGLEGVSDETLISVNKRNTIWDNNEAIRILQDNGVMIWGAFIVDPNWTVDQFNALRDYVYEKNITHTQFTILTPLPGTELYRQKQKDLLTSDYTCFDTLHAVVPTRLPRDEFYRQFASLYTRRNIEFIHEYLRQGRLTIEQVRFGDRIFKQFSQCESYMEHDPILRHSNKTG